MMAHVLVAQLCLSLWDPTDCIPPGSSIHGISQARVLEWVAVSFSRASSYPRDQAHISCISCTGRRILYHWDTWEALWSWLGQVYSRLRLHACQEERWKDPRGCKRRESPENDLNFKWVTYPHTDPLTGDRNPTGSRCLNIICLITGWLASHGNVRTTPEKADLETSLKSSRDISGYKSQEREILQV